jgi:hypothetical protein
MKLENNDTFDVVYNLILTPKSLSSVNNLLSSADDKRCKGVTSVHDSFNTT